MLRILAFVVLSLIAFSGGARAVDDSQTQPLPSSCQLKNSGVAGSNQMYMPFPAPLKHGIDLTQWWEDSRDSAVSDADLRRLHDMGFDFVRLAISPIWLEIEDDDEENRNLNQLHCDIVSILNEGMTVILDLRPTQKYKKTLFSRPEEIIPRIEQLWNKLQPVIAELPSWRIYIEILDEPIMESGSWWRFQERIVDDLRPVFPGNTFIASPGPFNGWWEFAGKIPYRDSNVVYGFNFFEPLILTRRGDPDLTVSSNDDKAPQKDGQPENPESQAPASPAAQQEPLSPIIYPVDKSFNFNMNDPDVAKYASEEWNRTAISVLLGEVSAWRDHFNVVAICLEFGVYRQSLDDKSRYNWLKDVHQSLDDLSIPWAVWEYRGPYGLLDPQGSLDAGMMQALNLKKASLQ